MMKNRVCDIHGMRRTAIIVILAAALIMTVQASLAAGNRSGIIGRVLEADTGEPVANAYVYAYIAKPGARAAQIGAIGIADRISSGTAKDGGYKMPLPPGNYYIVARKRASGLNFGPLYKGDWYDHSTAREVLIVKEAIYLHLDFKLRQLTEPMFFQGLTAEGKKTSTGIRGKLLDADGQHVPGTFVMAFVNEDMRRTPDFTSTVTDDQGNYTLYLPEGGRYWIAARLGFMSVPRPGEPFARYDGSPDHSILVGDDQFLDGIDLILEPFVGSPPETRRPADP